MKAGKLKIFLSALIFSTVFALLLKWWQTGNPFQLSTILFGSIMLFNILAALAIWQLYFQKQMERSLAELKKIIIPLFALYLLVVLFVCLGIIALAGYLFNIIMGLGTMGYGEYLLQVELPGTLRVYSIIIFMVSAYFFYSNWSNAIDREQQLREENLKYRYRTLKSQVNPHFLFNSLNTLSEIIYVDIRKADHYIHELASMYRYILDNEEKDLISLEEEIQFVNLYFDLQKERDGNRIQLAVDLPNPREFKIIPISLQILIENALKHNSASDDAPLNIHIYKNNEYVIVTNNIRKRSTMITSRGTGLSNLKERVRLIIGKEMIVDTDGNQFTVKLPILNSSI